MVKLWFTYAARDLKAAKNTLVHGAEFKNISAFHSQQCAEKAVKGFLAHHKIRFSKTHDLESLSKDVAQIDSILAKQVFKLKNMNDYAVAYRYPDAEKRPMTVARAKTAIINAEKIYTECLKRVRQKEDLGLLSNSKNTKSKPQ